MIDAALAPLMAVAKAVLMAAVAVGAVVLVATISLRLLAFARGRAYGRVAAGERVRLVLAPPARTAADAELAVELVRGLHTRTRRGVDTFRVGWPEFDLRVVFRDDELAWEIECSAQMAAVARARLASLYPGIAIEEVTLESTRAVAVATGRTEAGAAWPLREVRAPEARVLRSFAGALAHAPAGVEVRLAFGVRPVPPADWRREVAPAEARATSWRSLVGTALVDALLFRSESSAGSTTPIVRSREAREAEAAKRRGIVGFDVAMTIEVAGVPAAAAQALLWHLVGFTGELDSGPQAIRWEIGAPRGRRGPAARLADWELAELWYLPDDSFDAAGFERTRPLGAAPPATNGKGPWLVIGTSRGKPLAIPAEVLPRHLAVFGATGTGKSTLLLNLVTALADADIGATVIDPHGDLTTDILGRIPSAAASRVHVLRLADRQHPRGFNFLERRTPDEAQLVTSEFVYLFEDLWPRFCGPKMQHYLRHALLTMLATPEPATIIELVRVLTDDDFRDPYVKRLTDPMVASFWRTEWPGPKERERDSSIKAVLNKLGAFVTYASIRNIVGQGISTIRPRALMDAGDILLVDLSGVGGDNANLFGAMLISRYLIDATGRQGTPRESRRQHVLVVDEAQRFDTRAFASIAVEGRKFGLGLAIATQSLGGLGERLRDTVLTNAATIALLAPGADDLRGLGRLVAPVSVDELAAMRRYEVLVRTPGPGGRPAVYGGTVNPPGPAHAARSAAIMAASDRRDARPSDAVAAEVRRRTGPVKDSSTDPSQPVADGKPAAGSDSK